MRESFCGVGRPALSPFRPIAQILTMLALDVREIATQLDVLQGPLRPKWSFPFHDYSPHTQEHEKAWLAAEAACRPQIDDLVRHWLACSLVPAMTEQQLYWFWLRLRAATRLLYPLVLKDGTSIFSVSPRTRHGVLVWTLIDWWSDQGRNAAFSEIIEPDFGPQTQNN